VVRKQVSDDFIKILDHICLNKKELKRKGFNARKYLETYFTAEVAYGQIMTGLETIGHKSIKAL